MDHLTSSVPIIARKYALNIFNELSEIIVNDLGTLKEKFEPYQQAFKCLAIFSVKIHELTEVLLQLVSRENFYSSKIVLRALIEHALKVEFMTQKTLRDGHAEIFAEYFLFCDLYEELQYQKSLDYKIKMLDRGDFDEAAYQEIVQLKPALLQYSKNEIKVKAEQFSFRNIFRFLNDDNGHLDKTDSLLMDAYEGYLHTGAIYSDLSSFVHGGPFADQFHLRLHLMEDEKKSELIYLTETVMVMHFVGHLATVSFFSKLDPKYLVALENIASFQIDFFQEMNQFISPARQ